MWSWLKQMRKRHRHRRAAARARGLLAGLPSGEAGDRGQTAAVRGMMDEMVLRGWFAKKQGYLPNTLHPATLNEKLLWLNLHRRDPICTTLADKLTCREYVAARWSPEILVPLLLVADSVDELIPERMPNEPMIIKTNHGCRGHVIVTDRAEADWPAVRETIGAVLAKNYYDRSHEWQYRDIQPRIMVERLLVEPGVARLTQYCVLCFHGVAHYVQVFTAGPSGDRSIFDRAWRIQPFGWPAPDAGVIPESGASFPRPSRLNEMLAIGEALSQDVPFARVDLYFIEDAIYFSEITLTPGYCCNPITPRDYDHELGQLLHLDLENEV